jgi:hypothetical protein
MLATSDHIIVGGGAIWLDAELWKGRTAKSTTFDSPPLDGRSSDISHFQCVRGWRCVFGVSRSLSFAYWRVHAVD